MCTFVVALRDKCKSVFILTLCGSLVLSCLPIQLAFAKSTESKEVLSKEQAEQAVSLAQQVEDLEGKFAGDNSKQSSLDTFDLLRQTPIDLRKDLIDSEVRQVKEGDFNARIQHLYHELEQAKRIQLSEDEKKRYIEFVESQIDDLMKLGVDGLDVDHFVDQSLSRRHFYRNDLKVRVFEKYSDRVKSVVVDINESDFKNSVSKNFSTSEHRGFSKEFKENAEYIFSLSSKKGDELLRFDIPIESIAFYDKYLVFIEKDTYNPVDKTIPLKFINLQYFRGSIGNDRMPIFQLPLHVKGDAFQSLSVESGLLKVNDIKLSASAISVVSDMFQISYNIAASLVDPNTVSHSKELIKEMARVLDQSLAGQEDLTKEQLKLALQGDSGLREILATDIDKLTALSQLENVKTVAEKGKVYTDYVKFLQDSIKDSEEHVRRATSAGEKHDAEAVVAGKKLKLLHVKNSFEDISEFELESSLKKVASQFNLNTTLRASNEATIQSRKFLSRMHMFIAQLVQPHPYGAAKLTESLAMVASGLSKKDKSLYLNGKQNIQSHGYYKFLKFGAGVTAAAVLGSQLPQPYTLDIHNALDLVNTMMNQAHGYLKYSNYGGNFVELLGISSNTVSTGASHVWPNYFSDGKAPKFLYGFANLVVIPLLVFGVPHLLVNTLKTGVNMWKLNSKNSTSVYEKTSLAWADFLLFYEQNKGHMPKAAGVKIWSRVSRLPNAPQWAFDRFIKYKDQFIQIQSEERVEYDVNAAEAENKVSGADIVLEEYEQQQLKEHLDRIETKAEQTRYGKSVKKIQSARSKIVTQSKDYAADKILDASYSLGLLISENSRSVQAMRSLAIYIQDETSKTKNIDTFARAIRQFMLSYPSVTNTYSFMATVWNYLFISRAFVFKPVTWYMLLMYPGYFNSVTDRFDKRLHLASKYNGGLRPHWTYWPLRVGAAMGVPSFVKLRELETTILPIEREAFDISVQKSQLALIRYVKDPKRLLYIFDSTQATSGGSSSSGIANLTDNKLKKLNSKERTFFRVYFNKIFDETMNAILKEKAFESTLDIKVQVAGEDKTVLLDVKEQMLDYKNVSPAMTEVIHAKVQAVSGRISETADVYAWSKKVTEDFSKVLTRKKINYHHKLMKSLDPRGAQLSRFNIVRKKKSDPKAMGRAVRSEVASLLVTVPVSLSFTFALYAGVTSGMLVPFNAEVINGPEFTNYMSRYLFYNGFVASMITGMMANTWVKIQTDARIDKLGTFYREALHRDQQRGYWRFYFKSTFRNPDNKWLPNHVHYLKLVLANMPAAFINIAIVNFTTMGRFSLDSFVSLYLLTYLTPLLGIGLKIEQGFELASKWVNGMVPRKLRADPIAQSYINAKIQNKRMVFNFYNTFYEQIVSKIQGIFALVDTEKFGSRSFLRLTFYGWTPVEGVANILRSMANSTDSIPGVRRMTEFFEYLIANNYESWEKLQPNPKFEKVSNAFQLLFERTSEKSIQTAVGAGAVGTMLIPIASRGHQANEVRFTVKSSSCERLFR